MRVWAMEYVGVNEVKMEFFGKWYLSESEKNPNLFGTEFLVSFVVKKFNLEFAIAKAIEVKWSFGLNGIANT